MKWPFRKSSSLKDWPHFSCIDCPGSIKLYCVIPSADRWTYDRIFTFADNPRIYGFVHHNYRGNICAIFGRDDFFTYEELAWFLGGLKRYVGYNESSLFPLLLFMIMPHVTSTPSVL